jgi:hypothetical protein
MTRLAKLMVLLVAAAWAQAPDVPKVDAGVGACWVDFNVSDAGKKPVYNATIHTLLRYGMVHKTDLQVGTNYEGKARVQGLPQNVKKPPMMFDVKKDTAMTTVQHDPATNCHASYDVTLPSSK